MLRPEVAELFELTSGTIVLHVAKLGRIVDLRLVDVAEAEQLVAGGFEWLRRKEVPLSAATAAPNDAGPAASTAGPAKGKKVKSRL